MYRLTFGGKWKLRRVEPGTLFMFPDTGNMALMTEYGHGDSKVGRGDAYLLESGEAVGDHVTGDTEVIVLLVEEDQDEIADALK
jgi:hypothetical protein